MRPVKGEKRRFLFRDPAPSRVVYRWNRLWLTPGFHRMLRTWLPLAACLGLVGLVFSDAGRREQMSDWLAELRRSVEERPEFMVTLMAIDGASDELALDIREVVPVDLPLSSFDLDLEAMRQQVETLDAVQRVDMRIKPGGILQIDVTERMPAVVWRSSGGLELLDAEGNRVAALETRQSRPDLLLVVGAGANLAVPEALTLWRAAAPIQNRAIGLVRIAEQRWDLVLDRDQRIMLPEAGAVAALDRAIALNEAQDLLARNISRVDFRNPQRPILRLAPEALRELRALRGIIDVKDRQE